MNSAQIKVAALLVFTLLAAALYNLGPLVRSAPIGTGFAAKILCSSVFISGREAEQVLQQELQAVKNMAISASVDAGQRSATATIYGLFERTAIFRDRLGCTLLIDGNADQLRAQTAGFERAVSQLDQPTGEFEASSGDLDNAQLEKVMDTAFAEPDPDKPRNTRAVVILRGGKLLAERYARGFTPATPQLGWSMTKSVNSALVGILVKQGKLVTADPAPVPEWQGSDDPRKGITLDQLLRMSSGLKFQETYEENPVSDVNVMLFASVDAAASAAAKPLQVPPDTHWSYSSGTTNILSRIVRHAVPDPDTDYLLFPHRELFAKLGTANVFMEPDPSGTFVASSFMYATPRDWAKLGQLYLQDGVWQGERILPEGWVTYSRTPTPHAPVGRYGAQFWLNQGEEKWLSHLPGDLFAMSGHDGQFVLILPTQDLVVVRLGYSPGVDRNELLAFVVELLKLIPATSTT